MDKDDQGDKDIVLMKGQKGESNELGRRLLGKQVDYLIGEKNSIKLYKDCES